MKLKYKVLLPIDVDGRIYHHGEEIELDLKTATEYAHALQALPAEPLNAPVKEEEPTHGGNS